MTQSNRAPGVMPDYQYLKYFEQWLFEEDSHPLTKEEQSAIKMYVDYLSNTRTPEWQDIGTAPIAFAVKDYSDGWVLFHHNERDRAMRIAAEMGAMFTPLYAAPPGDAQEGE